MPRDVRHDVAWPVTLCSCLDNAFVHLNDPEAAQKLAEAIRPDRLHKRLDEVVKA